VDLVIRQLDAEMIFYPREHLERLQAVDAEPLEEITGAFSNVSFSLRLARTAETAVKRLVFQPYY
jgi:hypothetical protein